MASAHTSRVIVKNLPKHMTDSRFRELFGQIAPVTDCRIMSTKDGKPRQFGFVGFKNGRDASAAVKHFNGTFIDTSRVEVELARPANDAGLSRPWSRYSKGSSAYDRAHGGSEAAKKGFGKDLGQFSKGGLEGKKPLTAAALLGEPEEMSPELQRFLSVMRPRNPNDKRVWANDLDMSADIDATTAPAKSARKNKKTTFGQPPAEETAEPEETAQAKPGEEEKEQKEGKTEEKASEPAPKSRKRGLSDPSPSEKDSAEQKEDVDTVTAPSQKKRKTDTNLTDVAQWEEGRLFVRNLPFTMTQEELTKVFAKFGSVMEVHIPIDTNTKKPKGFGFVRFSAAADALKAYTGLDGSIVQGRLIHILPARADQMKGAQQKRDKESGEYKNQRESKLKATASHAFNWNSMFVRQDTVAAAMAQRLSLEKSDLIGKDAQNTSVRVALAEAHVIAETKQYLADQGINVSELERGPASERSTTAILVKNLPHDTAAAELSAMFTKFGEVQRLVLPPSKALAVIEMGSTNAAKAAFRALSYAKYKSVPLFLEWAPALAVEEAPEKEDEEPAAAEAEVEQEPAVAEETREGIAPTHTLLAKNLHYDTTDVDLRNVFQQVASVRSVRIARTKAPESKSLGFAFIEFTDHDGMMRAMRQLQGTLVNGRALDLALSQRKQDRAMADASQALDKRLKKATKPVTAQASTMVDTEVSSATAQPAAGATTKVVIRNLPFEATRKELRDLLNTFAQVKSVRIPKRFNGHHRGFAFAEFLTKQEAANAVEALKNTHFYGRHLVFEFAKS
eukprot:TRINITY_DN4713_c0_g1_i1.p1 TRINITY_DN4713_c0_g1~~TRINITY_DN4713_c0_g1_i1.p1  ORF type:complete len:808 (+),score=204.29 TRINITY_DN4713_c0_g1_i1:53-2425(+)